MELHEEIIKVLSAKGIKDSEEYRLKVSRNDMDSELTMLGFDKEDIDREIERLCNDGTLAMDEVNIYEYDEPV